MKKVAFFLLFLFLSCTVLNAARGYCKYAYQEDRAIPLILNYGIRLGVVGAGVANVPAPGGSTYNSKIDMMAARCHQA
ncbi:hypothetical protein [Campylobacter coli]|uniref:hypothetical protein n=1 Tax=Campylobacter coli TaxID=195 RepID=UPI00069A35F3|nr:hypothetical protein [Campylobacter coli]